MNTKEQMIKNILVNLLGTGSKSLNLKGTISFDLDVSFKEDGKGDITIDVNREEAGDDPVTVTRKSNGEGWDSI